MKISIITITLNSSDTIRDCLDSLSQQDVKCIEHIVVDGMSSDNTVDIVKEYNNLQTKLIIEKDEGIYDALNKGIEAATGDFVGVLHSDDFFFDKNTVSNICQILDSQPDLDLLVGNALYVDRSSAFKCLRKYDSSSFKRWMLRFGFMPAHTATFINKDIFKEFGRYRKEYESAGDFEFFVRVFQKKEIKVKFVNKEIVKMRVGGKSSSGLSSYIRTTRELVKALKENNIYSNLIFVSLRLPIKIILKQIVR